MVHVVSLEHLCTAPTSRQDPWPGSLQQKTTSPVHFNLCTLPKSPLACRAVRSLVFSPALGVEEPGWVITEKQDKIYVYKYIYLDTTTERHRTVFTIPEVTHFWSKYFAEVGGLHLASSSCFKVTQAIRIPWKTEKAPPPPLISAYFGEKQ